MNAPAAMAAPALTLAEAARIMRAATKDKSYLLFPLGEDVGDYLRHKRKRLTKASFDGYESVLDKLARHFTGLRLKDLEPPAAGEGNRTPTMFPSQAHGSPRLYADADIVSRQGGRILAGGPVGDTSRVSDGPPSSAIGSLSMAGQDGRSLPPAFPPPGVEPRLPLIPERWLQQEEAQRRGLAAWATECEQADRDALALDAACTHDGAVCRCDFRASVRRQERSEGGTKTWAWLDLIALCREDGIELPESEIRAAAVDYLERGPDGGGNRWGVAGTLIALHTDQLCGRGAST